MPKGKGYKDDPLSSGSLGKLRPKTKKEKAAGKTSKGKKGKGKR